MRKSLLLFPFVALSIVACDGGSDGSTDTDTDGSGGGSDDPVDVILALNGDATAGETVYAQNCVACHSTDGTGGVGSDLTAELPNLSDEEIVETIYTGSGAMSGFGTLIDDQGIADVTAYIKAEFG